MISCISAHHKIYTQFSEFSHISWYADHACALHKICNADYALENLYV